MEKERRDRKALFDSDSDESENLSDSGDNSDFDESLYNAFVSFAPRLHATCILPTAVCAN